MLRSAASKAMWVGRTTAAVIGLAIALAIVFGVATMALAAVPGDPFKLGKINSINRVSSLVGSVTGPLLKVDNNGGGPALRLEANSGKAPMVVNAGAGTAKNLSADKLDGKDAPLWAVVRDDGTLVRSNGATSSSGSVNGLTGVYKVVFNKDVSQCATTATVGGPNNGFYIPAVIQATPTGNTAFVETRSSNGSAGDFGFHLTVNC